MRMNGEPTVNATVIQFVTTRSIQYVTQSDINQHTTHMDLWNTLAGHECKFVHSCKWANNNLDDGHRYKTMVVLSVEVVLCRQLVQSVKKFVLCQTNYRSNTKSLPSRNIIFVTRTIRPIFEVQIVNYFSGGTENDH